MPWGMEGPGAALACRCPVRGTSGPRCICAGRFDYPAGTHRTRGQCDRPGGVTREAPRDGSGVHTPTVHRQPPCPWYCVFRHAAAWGGYSCGATWGGAPPFRVPPGAEHLLVTPT
eukprot:scaffold23604_cov27-Phaeocystis_antarctica.AAC.1